MRVEEEGNVGRDESMEGGDNARDKIRRRGEKNIRQ